MFQRIVCFKFKENATAEQIQKHMDELSGLQKKIPQIIHYSAGKTIPGDFGALPEYDVMHYLTFNTPNDIDDYFRHEQHNEFIQRNKEIWEKVLVINSECD